MTATGVCDAGTNGSPTQYCNQTGASLVGIWSSLTGICSSEYSNAIPLRLLSILEHPLLFLFTSCLLWYQHHWNRHILSDCSWVPADRDMCRWLLWFPVVELYLARGCGSVVWYCRQSLCDDLLQRHQHHHGQLPLGASWEYIGWYLLAGFPGFSHGILCPAELHW